MTSIKITAEPFGVIQVVYTDGHLWFKAKDIATILGYIAVSNVVKHHVASVNVGRYGELMKKPVRGAHFLYINEAGLRQLLKTTKVPATGDFCTWVTEVLLPQLTSIGGLVEQQTAALKRRVAAADERVQQCTSPWERHLVKTEEAAALKAAMVNGGL